MDFFELLKYAFLGLLQGVTEPIPVSSSGHLIIAEHLLGIHIEGLSFEVLVNFASLIAVLIIYRHDIVRIAGNGWLYLRKREPEARADFMFIIYVIVGTVPIVIFQPLLGGLLDRYSKDLNVIGVTLLITGIALWLIRNMRGRKQDNDLRYRDAIIVGLAQCVALFPGISRSGSTIVAAMGTGMRPATALRYSFFLYIPVSIGAMVLEGRNMLEDPMLGQLLVPYSLAFICSLIASYFALRWFMGIMAKGNLLVFSIYCLLAGLAVLIFL
ncbi:Undecaprenyl-diphosphatase [compost metagenome]